MSGFNPQQMWRDEVRRAFGVAMLRDAMLLKLIGHGVRMLLKGDQVNALSGTERRHLRAAALEIETARRRLYKLGKRCANETE